jgi:hypothetical protein
MSNILTNSLAAEVIMDITALTMLGDFYMSRLNHKVPSSISGPDIFRSTLFLDPHDLCLSFRVRGHIA